MAATVNIRFDRAIREYTINGRVAGKPIMKAAADAVVRASMVQVNDLSIRLKAGQITLDEWYQGMQDATKVGLMANTALARGGWENMREADWQRVEQKVAEQWDGVRGKYPGLRRFAEDVRDGRYGENLDRGNFLDRAGMYADAGRSQYENETVVLAKEDGHDQAMRVLAASDHCDDCVAWAGEWQPIDECPEIAESICGNRCYCVIVTRMSGEQ